MIKKLTITALMLSLMPLAGCGSSDSNEQALADTIACMDEMGATLATVKDKASAEAAKPIIEAAAKRLDSIKVRMKELSKPDAAQEKAMNEKYGERMKEAMGKMMKESMRVAMIDPAITKLLAEAMAGLAPK
jgi:hypothetical protein